MRRNGDLLPTRREHEGGLTPWAGMGVFSPSSFLTESPWVTLRRMQEDMDRLFSQIVAPVQSQWQELQSSWAPKVDISQDDREWMIEADLPGVKPDDIHVEVQGNHLVLRAEMRQEKDVPQHQGDGRKDDGKQVDNQQGDGQKEARQYAHRERHYGYFERVLPLPQNVDDAQIRCDYRDGVLKVHLPKTAEAKLTGRRIPIGSGEPVAPVQSAEPEKAEKATRKAA